MRKVLFVLLLLVGGVSALGFYRGWFSFEIDQNQFKQDIEMVRQKIGGG